MYIVGSSAREVAGCVWVCECVSVCDVGMDALLGPRFNKTQKRIQRNQK